MILGIAIEHDNLLLSTYSSRSLEAQFYSFKIESKSNEIDSDPSRSIWSQVDEKAVQLLELAEKMIFALPAENSYLKKVSIDSKGKDDPEYHGWIAGKNLPGNLDDYSFKIIPIRKSYDSAKSEILLCAITSKMKNLLDIKLKPADNREIEYYPEQLGFVQTLGKSLRKDEFSQAGIINCRPDSAVAVYAKNGSYEHSRIFKVQSANKNEISTDIETYFLSRADSSEPMPLVITGFTGCFTSSWSPIIPAFMGIHNLEFAGAWGIADFIRKFSEDNRRPI